MSMICENAVSAESSLLLRQFRLMYDGRHFGAIQSKLEARESTTLQTSADKNNNRPA